MVGRPELRPLGVGEIIDVAIKVYRSNAATLLKIIAVVIIPITVLSILVELSAIPEGARVVDGQLGIPATAGSGGLIAGTALVALISFVATLIATGAAFRAIGDAYLGRRPDVGTSFGHAGRRAGSLVWAALLTAVLVGLGFVLLVIPGIYLAVGFAVVVPVLMMEDRRGLAALSRSRELVKGMWWRTLGTFLLGVFLIPVVVGALIGFVFGLVILAGVESVTSYVILDNVSSLIADIITTPLAAAVIAVLYFDLRVRKEAFDLELLARQMGSDTGPAGGPPPFAG